MGVIMRMMIAARSAVEGHEHQPPAVEAGHEGRDHQHPERIVGADKGAFDHRVLRQEASKADMGQRDANAGNRQRPNHHRRESIGDLLAKAAIVAHVLLVMHRVDDRTGPQKQHRLEERMREQVEHCHRINADTRRHEHIAKLRTGRIGDHPLDVVLHKAHGRREERGGRAKDGDEGRGLGRIFKDRRHPANEEHARRHHGCRVDQRRHRGRAFHRVRQPCVQDQLRRFPHSTNEQQHPDQVRRVPFGPQEVQIGFRQHWARSEHIIHADAVGQEEQRENPQRKAEIADAVDHESLDRRSIGAWLAIVEADQQVRGNAHTFPAKEHLNKVIRRHQHQHREGKE